ncbi:hypothetical protein JL722_7167 [Aureococcus anophagefferens]|nr:hypothetical protein JL722_7167 [Aureococcus anophagefferens]
MRASMEVYRAARAHRGRARLLQRALPDRRDPALAQRAFAPADFDGVYARAAEAQAALVANEYGGDASLLKDLARCTVHFADCGRLAEALGRLSGGVRVRQLKNKFASPTPMGYRLRGNQPVYACNFRRAFPGGGGDPGWRTLKPLVELIASAQEPLPVGLAGAALGWASPADRDAAVDAAGALFPLRDGRFHVFHKTVVDWLTGDVQGTSSLGSAAPADFAVSRDAGHGARARAARGPAPGPRRGSGARPRPAPPRTANPADLLADPDLAYALRHAVVHVNCWARVERHRAIGPPALERMYLEIVCSLPFLELTAVASALPKLLVEILVRDKMLVVRELGDLLRFKIAPLLERPALTYQLAYNDVPPGVPRPRRSSRDVDRENEGHSSPTRSLDAAVAHVAWAPDDRALAVHDGKTLVVLSLAGRLYVGALFEVVACEVVAGDAGDADMPGCVAWTSATTVVVPVVTRPASGAPAVVLARRDEARAAPDDRGLARYGFAPRHRPGVKRRPKGGKFNGGHSGNHVVALGDGRCVVGAGSENFRGYLYDVSGDGAAPVLATLDTDGGAVVVFDAASGDKLAHTESPEYVHQWWNYSCVCVSDDGEKMCSVDEKTVRLWKSLGEGRPGDEWQAALAEPLAGDVAHGETIRRCAFEPNKWGTYTRLITAGEHELFFWAAKDLETYETAVTHRDYVESLDWTADGRLFVSAGDRRRNGALHFWAGDTGDHLLRSGTGPFRNVALAPDGRLALVDGTSVVELAYDGGALALNPAGKIQGKVDAGSNRPPTCKKYALRAGSDRLYLWISSNCDECDEASLPHHLVEYEDDGAGTWARTRAFDHLAHVPLWHPRDATRALAQLPGGGCAAIHGETLELVAASPAPSRPPSPRPRRGGDPRDDGARRRVPDGRLVVSCTARTRLTTVSVYDAATFEPSGYYVPCDGSAAACAFSPTDPRALAVADTSGGVALYRLIVPSGS